MANHEGNPLRCYNDAPATEGQHRSCIVPPPSSAVLSLSIHEANIHESRRLATERAELQHEWEALQVEKIAVQRVKEANAEWEKELEAREIEMEEESERVRHGKEELRSRVKENKIREQELGWREKEVAKANKDNGDQTWSAPTTQWRVLRSEQSLLSSREGQLATAEDALTRAQRSFARDRDDLTEAMVGVVLERRRLRKQQEWLAWERAKMESARERIREWRAEAKVWVRETRRLISIDLERELEQLGLEEGPSLETELEGWELGDDKDDGGHGKREGRGE
ncbi:hypothetical protein CERZMDRAFT_87845 [Cercospora zeae-maydis SCOH1-5]|uniref:Uncharacterized protein n=1 Tax=Cercospora zeae-maydis SCOH1-5 TaxID=717836 RepID=A0A6A6F3G0_9PEZI|nr:hypothetical protein CERZMDRAFT_87845 [Cercospora zeae-maydis SCOH1-5]